MTTATEIIERKHEEGPDAYLWVHTGGDVLLWRHECEATDDGGEDAVVRWYVDSDVVDKLIKSGEVDELA